MSDSPSVQGPPDSRGRTSTTADVLNPDPAVITVWSDIGCPWAGLALHRLHDAIADRGAQILIDHRAFPLELFNKMPTPKGLLDSEVVVIAGRFPELGWQLWNGAEHAYPSTTLPALQAVQAIKAASWGGLAAADQFDTAVRRALFVHSRSIHIHAELLAIAEDCDHVDSEQLAAALELGTGLAEVYQQWRTAGSDAIQGSPHLMTRTVRLHNPGVTYHWTARPPLDHPYRQHGFPVIDNYDQLWPDQLLAPDRVTEN